MNGTSSLIPPLNRNESSFGSPITISAPSLRADDVVDRRAQLGARRDAADGGEDLRVEARVVLRGLPDDP